eukprot:10680957-Ditylum_brightwellii.AAC.1
MLAQCSSANYTISCTLRMAPILCPLTQHTIIILPHSQIAHWKRFPGGRTIYSQDLAHGTGTSGTFRLVSSNSDKQSDEEWWMGNKSWPMTTVLVSKDDTSYTSPTMLSPVTWCNEAPHPFLPFTP